MMAETNCGKSCAECISKEALSCPGCKAGPGRQYGGDCELAKCCISKGHEVCETCGFRNTCGTFRSREHRPEYRRKKAETEALRIATISKRAPVLGKWLWILFWLIIPSTIASILSNERVAGMIPSFYIPGQILSAACSFAYGLILLRLASEERRYRAAGICRLTVAAASLLTTVIAGSAQASAWTLLLAFLSVIAALVGEYNEFMAHAAVLSDVDAVWSEKWRVLWKWYIGSFCAMVGGPLVIWIASVLGALVLLAAAIGVIVVEIWKLVYLYRAAKLFRAYTVKAGL